MKWPRTYAAEIMSETSLKTRREMLEQVPAHLQSLVKKHVEIAYELKKLRKNVGHKR